MLADPPWSGPVDPPRATYLQRLTIPLLLTIGVAALIAMLEVDRLLGSFVVTGAGDRAGQAATLADATGFAAWTSQDVWQTWAAAAGAGEGVGAQIATLIHIYVALDTLFLVTYVPLLVMLVWRSSAAGVGVALLALAELFESGAILLAAGSPVDPFVTGTVAVAAYVKWGAVVFIVAAAMAASAARRAIWLRLRRAVAAVRVHALALVFVIVLGMLTLVSRSGIFDQLPDVQREWAGTNGIAYAPLLWAGFAVFVAAFSFWLLGRRRSEIARRERWDGLPEASPAWWVALPFGALCLVIVAAVAAGGRESAVWMLPLMLFVTFVVAMAADRAAVWWSKHRVASVFAWLFVGLALWLVIWLAVQVGGPVTDFGPIILLGSTSLVVLVLSLVMVWVSMHRPGPGILAEQEAPRYAGGASAARTIWLTGDAIWVFTLVLVPWGLIRSFTSPVLAYAIGVVDDDPNAIPAQTLLALGVGLTILGPPVAVGLVWAFDRFVLTATAREGWRAFFDPRMPSAPHPLVSLITDVAAVAVGIGIVGFATLEPELFASAGPVAATVLLLTGWLCLLGGVILSLQRHKPMPIFRAFGLKATPVLVLTLACGVITSLFLTDARVHAVRVAETATPASDVVGSTDSADARFTAALEERFTQWQESAQTCTVTSGATQTEITPLVLVAAAGGGGRAAYWTVASLDAFRAVTGGQVDGEWTTGARAGCLSNALFAASGISGGSVGLVMDQVSESPLEQTDDLISPDPLARVVTGLLAGDLVAGYTGVRVPTIDERWTDRAGLLETGWENATVTGTVESPLASAYTRTPDDDEGAQHPFLLINSADAVSGCRVTVVQLDVDAPATAPGAGQLAETDCGRQDTGAAYTVAFDDMWPGCSERLNWSTVALLSARFPYVTPGGRMPVPDDAGCDEGRTAQLVDGGYSEDTGLASLADLLPELSDLIVEHNAGPGPDVVPYVLFLKNDLGFELSPEVKQAAAEAVVPLTGLDARAQQNREAAWLQRIADQLEEVPADSDIGPRIVVMSPNTVPTVSPPLGWTLSKFSRNALDQAVQDQLDGRCVSGQYLCIDDFIGSFTG
ncbi:hypothetical protein ACFQRL_01030 [Microbacterium fluvii]|uniref:PNPLA domain-containing protein n=2 Tax=Microbacterium fluvii TaxID=415215 RepID=A0ABW2H9M4_9MICO